MKILTPLFTILFATLIAINSFAQSPVASPALATYDEADDGDVEAERKS